MFLNLDPGSYTATIQVPNTVYYKDESRNLTCTYLAASATSNSFTVSPSYNYLEWDDTQQKLVSKDTGTDKIFVYELDGTEGTLGTDGQTTWYVAQGTDLSYTGPLTLQGDAHLILADDCNMNVVTDSGSAICGDGSLTIYAQSAGDRKGKLTATGSSYGIYAAADVILNGGDITATATAADAGAIVAEQGFTYNGGTVTTTATGTGAHAISALGGLYTFSWSSPDDHITIGTSGLYSDPDAPATVTFTRLFSDDDAVIAVITRSVTDSELPTDHYYGGTLTTDALTDLNARIAITPDGLTLRGTERLNLTDDDFAAVADPYASNITRIAAADGIRALALAADRTPEPLTVLLEGRRLWKDGDWNTLCLPFALSDFTDTPLEGATVKTLVSSSFENGTLTINFTDDENNLTSIDAGVPYIVKWSSQTPDYVDNPVFADVIVTATVPSSITTDGVDFVGTFSPVDIFTAENTNLYLGSANTLYYPWADGMTSFNLNAFRAYFKLNNGLTAGDPADPSTPIKAFKLNFGEEETGIETVQGSGFMVNGEGFMVNGFGWYTLDGRRLDAQPAAPGIYLHNGRKLLIK
ncbi:MAG: hypothetical protein IKX59_00270 [Bacteroidales bacterium]|nr:hypothetical protein [Bacteroidales bacterium]